MRIEGNDHLIEYSEVHSAVRESDDQGAMELFMNPTYRGVVFRHNYFHDTGKTGFETAVHGQAAIRLDDAISGMHIYGNLFVRASGGGFGAVQINGGRDNLIENNLFVDCGEAITGGWYRDNAVWVTMRDGSVPDDFFLSDLYLARYPELGHLLDEPGINQVRRNLLYRCDTITQWGPEVFDLSDNAEYAAGEDPGFVDAESGDFRLRPDAPALVAGFFPLPVERMGLYADERRPS